MTIDDKIKEILKAECASRASCEQDCETCNNFAQSLTAIKSALLEEVNRLPGRGDYGYIYKKDLGELLK
jgi:hypothetical protein